MVRKMTKDGIDNSKYKCGIVTGAPSGIFAMIVNGQAGSHSLELLERTFEECVPHTAKAITTRFQEYFFETPKGLVVPYCLHLLPGLEIRGNGARVLIPPSIIDGEALRWADGCGPTELDPANPPAWMVDTIIDLKETL